MNVKEVMTTNVACCNTDASLQEVARLMQQNDCGAIPVMEGNRLAGIITDRDIVVRAVAAGKNVADLDAGSCMSPSVSSIEQDADLEECIRLMEDNQVRRIVVTNGSGEICGIVAQADIALNAPERETGEVVREVSK